MALGGGGSGNGNGSCSGRGRGGGQVCPMRWFGLGAPLLKLLFFSPVNFDSPCFLLSDPKVNWFSFFGLIGSNGSVRLEIMLLPFASFPLHDTPKLAGAVIYSLTH